MSDPQSTPQLLTQRCQALRQALLDLHRQLLELERRRYEKLHGAQSAGDSCSWWPSRTKCAGWSR